jgi:hypothetical protein
MAQYIPLDWYIHIGNVMQNEIDERLVPFLSKILDKRLGFKSLAHLVSNKTIFGKTIIEIING